MSKADSLLKQHPIISEQVNAAQLRVILAECEQSLERAEGDIVEMGCYIGTTSLFLARLLEEHGATTLYAYDSFEGLPEKSLKDRSPVGEQFKAGELMASKKAFIARFRQAGLPLPIVKKAWFSDLRPDDMPSAIAFAFLDGDYYASITDSLALTWPRLTPGACVIVDDYANLALPGARQAVDEWLREYPARLDIIAGLAVVRPTTS